MSRFERLDLINGDFFLVKPPSVLNHAYVRRLQLELHQTIRIMDVSNPDSDLHIFVIYENYYQKILDIIAPDIKASRIESNSRHSFFVCNLPIIHPNTGEVVLGLSRLEELMGYSYNTIQGNDEHIKPVEDEEISPTSGDNITDAIADTLLIFKRTGFKLLETFSLEELCKINLQASLRMQQSQQSQDSQELNKSKNIKNDFSISHDSSEVTKPNLEDVRALESLNISIPPI